MPTEPTTPRVKKSRTPKPRRPGVADWFHNLTKQAKASFAILTGVVALLVGLFAFDDRYALARDLKSLAQSQAVMTRAQEINAAESIISIEKVRRSQVQDKIHDLRGKQGSQRLAPHEVQSLARFDAELADIMKSIDQKQRYVDRLKLQQ